MDENVLKQIFNSRCFKNWLLVRRWFRDKSSLSELNFTVNILYFKVIFKNTILSVIKINKSGYTKSYFLPLIYFEDILDILEKYERKKGNIIKLKENTLVCLDEENSSFTLNLIEAEYCLFFWKNLFFNKNTLQALSVNSLELKKYSDEIIDKNALNKIQILKEAGLFPHRYKYKLMQMGGGDTTNLLFQLELVNRNNKNIMLYVLKSYKEFSKNIEPYKLSLLMKNKFMNAPKLYNTVSILKNDIIGVMENIPNSGTLGEIYWKELNLAVVKNHKKIKKLLYKSADINTKNQLINLYCKISNQISKEIGFCINYLHKSLIDKDKKNQGQETVEAKEYLNKYTKKINLIILKLQDYFNKNNNDSYNLLTFTNLLEKTKEIVNKLYSDLNKAEINIQPIHQDLHAGQVLYNKIKSKYIFYFTDFEGDPQFNIKEKEGKYPAEKDYASFLRSLSYIKFNTILKLINRKIIKNSTDKASRELLYSFYFKNTKNNTLKIIFQFADYWENNITLKIVNDFDLNKKLIKYFTIERILRELTYEFLFRPDNIIVPILGLKEITEIK